MYNLFLNLVTFFPFQTLFYINLRTNVNKEESLPCCPLAFKAAFNAGKFVWECTGFAEDNHWR